MTFREKVHSFFETSPCLRWNTNGKCNDAVFGRLQQYETGRTSRDDDLVYPMTNLPRASPSRAP